MALAALLNASIVVAKKRSSIRDNYDRYLNFDRASVFTTKLPTISVTHTLAPASISVGSILSCQHKHEEKQPPALKPSKPPSTKVIERLPSTPTPNALPPALIPSEPHSVIVTNARFSAEDVMSCPTAKATEQKGGAFTLTAVATQVVKPPTSKPYKSPYPGQNPPPIFTPTFAISARQILSCPSDFRLLSSQATLSQKKILPTVAPTTIPPGCVGARNIDTDCPCLGTWANHSQFVACVTNSSVFQVKAKFLTRDQYDKIVYGLSLNYCGSSSTSPTLAPSIAAPALARPGCDGAQNVDDACPCYGEGRNHSQYVACVTNSSGSSAAPSLTQRRPAPVSVNATKPTGCQGATNIDTACPCLGGWLNHSQYVACVTNSSLFQLTSNQITRSQYNDIVNELSRNDCGNRNASLAPTPSPSSSPGCLGAQNIDAACPCSGVWRNHEEYLVCVKNSFTVQVRAGLLTKDQYAIIILGILNNFCGKT